MLMVIMLMVMVIIPMVIMLMVMVIIPMVIILRTNLYVEVKRRMIRLLIVCLVVQRRKKKPVKKTDFNEMLMTLEETEKSVI